MVAGRINPCGLIVEVIYQGFETTETSDERMMDERDVCAPVLGLDDELADHVGEPRMLCDSVGKEVNLRRLFQHNHAVEDDTCAREPSGADIGVPDELARLVPPPSISFPPGLGLLDESDD